MAESTLSVTFQDLRKRVAYFLGYQRSFSEGTIAIDEGGLVSFDDNLDTTRIWPSWAASGYVVYSHQESPEEEDKTYKYPVAKRESDTQLELTDGASPTGTAFTEKPYELVPWDDRQFEDIDSAVENGLRRFYYPFIESEGKIHQWSFLRKIDSVTLDKNVQDYALADDVAHIVEDSVTYQANTSNRSPLTRVPESQMRAMRAEAKEGIPLYYAIRTKHVDDSSDSATSKVGQRFEMLVHPTPIVNAGDGDSIDYRYVRAPDLLTTSYKYPLGGALHSQTIIEACLAEAEKDMDDRADVHEQIFQKMLMASYRADLEVDEMEAGATTYDVDTVIYGTYQWLQQEVGLYLIENSNPDTFTTSEDKSIDSIIQRGLKQFYFPPTMEGQNRPHKWSFLCPTTSIPLGDGTFRYTLPEDFGQILGEFTWPADSSSEGTSRIPIIQVERLLQILAAEPATGSPKWAAVRPIAAELISSQKWEVLFYPQPDASVNSVNLSYKYLKVPAAMSGENLYPAGGDIHAETLLASCLSIAEIQKAGQMGAYSQLFMSRLSSSVQLDAQAMGITEDETYSDVEPVFGTFQWFQQEVGTSEYLKFGANPNSWSQSERREVDSIIQRGLKQFYVPPPMPGEGTIAHEWSFMVPESTISVWGDTEYTADSDDPDTRTVVAFAATGQTVFQSMVGKTLKFKTSGNTYTIASITENAINTTETMSGEVVSDTVTVQSDGDYLLPADHGGFVGNSLSYDEADDSYNGMTISSVARILALRQSNVSSSSPASRPFEAACKPNSTTNESQHRAVLMVWPVPDGTYTLHYQYHAIQPKLTDDKSFPMGTDMHSEAMLASCLSVAELKKTGKVGHERNNFMRLLAASISRDRNAFRPKIYGQNLDRSDSQTGSSGRWYRPAKYTDGITTYGGD